MQMIWKVMSRFIAGLLVLLLLACTQAGSPGTAGQNIAAGGAGAGGAGGGGAAGLITTTLAADAALKIKFPTMARLQLTVTGAAGVVGIPLQINVPLNGASSSLQLPANTLLTMTFDVFDAVGTYLGTGSAQTTVIANVNPVIPITITAVAPGTVYINPLTVIGGGGVVIAPVLSVNVVQAASLQPLVGATVMLGAGVATAITDASGVASFSGITLPQDVHVFSTTQAVSVMQFAGSALTVPMPDISPVSTTVTITPIGPTLALPSYLLDVYFTDGMSVQAIGGVGGDAAAVRTGLLFPMRGPVAVSAMIEDPAGLTPKTDFGFGTLTVNTGHHATTPLLASIPDPALNIALTPVGQSIVINPAPTGLSSLLTVQAEVFAVTTALTGDAYSLISHKDNNTLPANRRDISIWPVTGSNALMRHISVQDIYSAVSEAWQRELPPVLGTSFATLPAFPAVSSLQTATLAGASWIDGAGAPAWDGYVLELKQGARLWRVYGLQTATSVVLPAAPVGVSPLLTGVAATATVMPFVLNPLAGFSVLSPELWYLPRMLDQRAKSAPLSFIP